MNVVAYHGRLDVRSMTLLSSEECFDSPLSAMVTVFSDGGDFEWVARDVHRQVPSERNDSWQVWCGAFVSMLRARIRLYISSSGKDIVAKTCQSFAFPVLTSERSATTREDQISVVVCTATG